MFDSRIILFKKVFRLFSNPLSPLLCSPSYLCPYISHSRLPSSDAVRLEHCRSFLIIPKKLLTERWQIEFLGEWRHFFYPLCWVRSSWSHGSRAREHIKQYNEVFHVSRLCIPIYNRSYESLKALVFCSDRGRSERRSEQIYPWQAILHQPCLAIH